MKKHCIKDFVSVSDGPPLSDLLFFDDFEPSVRSSAQFARLLQQLACCDSEYPPGGALSVHEWLKKNLA